MPLCRRQERGQRAICPVGVVDMMPSPNELDVLHALEADAAAAKYVRFGLLGTLEIQMARSSADARLRAREARRLAGLPHDRTLCQTPMLFRVRS